MSDLEAACHVAFDKAHTKWCDEVCNGGFVQYLGNESGAFAQDLPEALTRVGLMEYVPIALELRALFPGGIPRDETIRWRAVEQLSETGTALEDLTHRFFEVHDHAADDSFRQKLFALIRNSRPDFVRSS